MHEIWVQIIAAWQAQSPFEIVAVFAAIMYLVLAIRENIWCWFFAFISTILYIYVFHNVSLLSESILNIYYLIMAFYGWYQWRYGNHQHERHIIRWPLRKHLWLILLTSIAVPILGYITSRYNATLPYLDAFTSCFAALATVMVAHKVLENWFYWLLVNILSVYVFASKDLYLTALMFILYVVLTIFGWLRWNKQYRVQQRLV